MRRCFDAVLAVAAPRLCGGSRSSPCWHCSLRTFNTAETAKAGLQHQSQDADCQESKPTTRPVTGNWSLPPPRASPPPPAPHPDDQRRLIVAVVGLPNAGKSTLVNRLAGTKVAGVSSKRNTTISPQLGAFSHGNAQVLLYDTPGLTEAHERSSALDRLRAAWATAAMADQLLLIVDAERMFRLRDQAPLRLARKLAEGPQSLPDATGAWPAPPTLLFLNKTDKIKPGVRDVALQQLHRQLAAAAPFALSLSGAAMHGEGVQQLRDHLVAAAKPGTWVLPPGVSHGASPAELAVELVRERLYRRLNQELPYRLAVSCEPPRPGPGGGLVLRVRVAVPNPRVRSIVVGRRGAIVQEYVTVPCQDALARVLGVPVRLEVTVTVTSCS